MLEATVKDNRLFIGDRFSVSFQRTLRLPDDGKAYPLPPGLGAFPIHSVEEFRDRVPESWRGWFIPMYQREALWLGFTGTDWKPNAVKIGIGNVNAVSGQPWDDALSDSPQNYLVCPDQPWLDGINTGNGLIRQFVAMPLGQGYTVEEQLQGTEFGGIQIQVYEPKPGRFPESAPLVEQHPVAMAMFGDMGLGAGGQMEQKIYSDRYGIQTWDQENSGSVFIHIINSEMYQTITGLESPPTPISAKTYTEYGFPWFSLYDETREDVAASEALGQVKTIQEQDAAQGIKSDQSLEIEKSQVKKLHHPNL